MQRGLLRYSQRAKLLRRAQKLGIGRFEANLVIATVQHRHATAIGTSKAHQDGLDWTTTALLILTIQSTIAAVIWFVVAA